MRYYLIFSVIFIHSELFSQEVCNDAYFKTFANVGMFIHSTDKSYHSNDTLGYRRDFECTVSNGDSIMISKAYQDNLVIVYDSLISDFKNGKITYYNTDYRTGISQKILHFSFYTEYFVFHNQKLKSHYIYLDALSYYSNVKLVDSIGINNFTCLHNNVYEYGGESDSYEEWYINGNKKKEVSKINGVDHQLMITEYYENGKVKSKGVVQFCKSSFSWEKIGSWDFYNERGRKKTKLIKILYNCDN